MKQIVRFNIIILIISLIISSVFMNGCKSEPLHTIENNNTPIHQIYNDKIYDDYVPWWIDNNGMKIKVYEF